MGVALGTPSYSWNCPLCLRTTIARGSWRLSQNKAHNIPWLVECFYSFLYNAGAICLYVTSHHLHVRHLLTDDSLFSGTSGHNRHLQDFFVAHSKGTSAFQWQLSPTPCSLLSSKRRYNLIPTFNTSLWRCGPIRNDHTPNRVNAGE